MSGTDIVTTSKDRKARMAACDDCRQAKGACLLQGHVLTEGMLEAAARRTTEEEQYPLRDYQFNFSPTANSLTSSGSTNAKVNANDAFVRNTYTNDASNTYTARTNGASAPAVPHIYDTIVVEQGPPHCRTIIVTNA